MVPPNLPQLPKWLFYKPPTQNSKFPDIQGQIYQKLLTLPTDLLEYYIILSRVQSLGLYKRNLQLEYFGYIIIVDYKIPLAVCLNRYKTGVQTSVPAWS